MKCYSLLLGARNTRAGATRFSREDDDHLRAITFRHFPEGFTILNADGGWFDGKRGEFIQEESRQILVCSARAHRLRRWCAELAGVLGQSELLVVEQGRAATFRFRPKRSTREGARHHQ